MEITYIICKGKFQVTDKNVSVKGEMKSLIGKNIGFFPDCTD